MPARNTPTCPAVVPLCGTKAEVTVPSLDDWEKQSSFYAGRGFRTKESARHSLACARLAVTIWLVVLI
jgi:hypothetical protein